MAVSLVAHRPTAAVARMDGRRQRLVDDGWLLLQRWGHAGPSASPVACWRGCASLCPSATRYVMNHCCIATSCCNIGSPASSLSYVSASYGHNWHQILPAFKIRASVRKDSLVGVAENNPHKSHDSTSNGSSRFYLSSTCEPCATFE